MTSVYSSGASPCFHAVTYQEFFMPVHLHYFVLYLLYFHYYFAVFIYLD